LTSSRLLVSTMIPFLITIIPSLMVGFFARKFDSRYPKQGEARYTEKVLSIKDEGERHIILVSMFKTYHINLVLIMLGVVLLVAFSIRTGINQSIGLLILIVLFVYNAFIISFFSSLSCRHITNGIYLFSIFQLSICIFSVSC